VRDNFRHFIFRDQRSLIGVFLGGIRGDETVEEYFKQECSLKILSKKKVANICDSDWEEASEGRRGEGLRSRRVLMEFQSS